MTRSIDESDMSDSNLAATLGDPNFPRILTGSLRSERIIRYQQIFQDYSRLEMSWAYDRPIAIDSLQRRLLRVWGVKGGFGVFDDGKSEGLICRSLLWHRGDDSKDRSLEFIKFHNHRSVSPPPSWSWMAYTGGIDYFQQDFGRIDWEQVEMPWNRMGGSGDTVALMANAQKYDPSAMSTVDKNSMLIFDQVARSSGSNTFCVVLGREKGGAPISEKTYYFLLASASDEANIDGLPVFRRVGAGFCKGLFSSENRFRIALV